MTREEAIELLEERKKFNRTMQRGWEQSEGVTASGKTINTASFAKQHKDEADALDLALTALRPVSREQVEQIKGVWIFNDDWWEFLCSECHKGIGNIEKYKFCPHCGAPMTDEAVEMVMERLEALDGEENS